MFRCSSAAIFSELLNPVAQMLTRAVMRRYGFNRKTAGDGALLLVVDADAVSRKRSRPRAIAQREACCGSVLLVIVRSPLAKRCSFARIVEIGGKRTQTHTESSPQLEFRESKVVMWVNSPGACSGWPR